MATTTIHPQSRPGRAGWRRLGGLLATLALTLVLGVSAGRAHAQQPSPQLVGGFPALSLSYSDAQGPGSARITPQGADGATGGTAIALSISQSAGTYSGTGFVRQLDGSGFIIAATITGEYGDSYFVAGTLARGPSGAQWRGHGRWSA